MISFRFYLVTLVAVFLAIALGVVIGSTFIEPALVENLRGQVDTVRGNLDERVQTIEELNSDVDELETYVEQAAPFAVDRRLAGTTVMVVAEQGLDTGPVERLVGRLRQAGAASDGIVWLDSSWLLVDENGGGAEEELEEAAGVRAAGTEQTQRAAWQRVLLEASMAGGVELGEVSGAATTGPSTSTTRGSGNQVVTSTSVDDPSEPPSSVPGEGGAGAGGNVLEVGVLDQLEDAGFVELQMIDEGESPGPELPSPTERPLPFGVVVVTGSGSDLQDDGQLAAGLARQQAALGVPTVVTEIHPGGEDAPEPGTQVAPVREDAELSALVATVDDLQLVQGRVATVLALSDLRRGVAGHYGYGAGAERVLPPWLGP